MRHKATWEEMTHGKKMAIGLLLSFPIYVSAAWLLSIAVSNNGMVGQMAGVRLSPVRDPTPIIIGLLIFISGYAIFLGLLFSDVLKKITKFFTKGKKQKRFVF